MRRLAGATARLPEPAANAARINCLVPAGSKPHNFLFPFLISSDFSILIPYVGLPKVQDGLRVRRWFRGVTG
jgi:hypothetical protein